MTPTEGQREAMARALRLNAAVERRHEGVPRSAASLSDLACLGGDVLDAPHSSTPPIT